MSYWTLKLLEIMIALFYFGYIMSKRCLKDLNIFIIHLCLQTLHHMIQKYTWLRIIVIVFLQEKYAQIVDSLIFGQTLYALILPILLIDWVNILIIIVDVISKLLKCVKGTINFGFTYCDYPAMLKGYYDVNCIFYSNEQSQLMAIMENFFIEEDICLVSSWMHFNQDPVQGMNQRHTTLWKRIHTNFHEQKSFLSTHSTTSRMNRWSIIQ